jgi:hypothetical protein
MTCEQELSTAGDMMTAAAVKLLYDGYAVEYTPPPVGQLYAVEIPEDDDMLLWDKPLSEHPAKVRDAIRLPDESSWRFDENPGWAKLTGQQFYEAIRIRIGMVRGSARAASLFLLDRGIKGIKYLDGASRADGEGSYNYVIFSEDDVAIAKTFYEHSDGTPGRGQLVLQDRLVDHD